MEEIIEELKEVLRAVSDGTLQNLYDRREKGSTSAAYELGRLEYIAHSFLVEEGDQESFPIGNG